MNNIKYYNDSLAYDFGMFAPKPATTVNPKDNIVVMPNVRKNYKNRKKAATKAVSAPTLLVLTAFIVLAGLCGNIALRLQINEVNSKINDVKSEINTLESKKTALEVELERVISYSNIELEAAQIGMQKMDKDQVKYIRVNDKNTAVTKNGKTVEIPCE